MKKENVNKRAFIGIHVDYLEKYVRYQVEKVRR